jgi:hypothetical protein
VGPSEAIHSALFDALGQTGITVYAVAPQAANGGSAAEFPYAHIGIVDLREYDTQTDNGMDFLVRIHCRWRGSSRTPGLQMQDTIYQFLHHATLIVDNATHYFLARESSTVLDLPDGNFDGVCEYRGLIEIT